jgi:radical SAM protein with 4Fe4S-binding SPASM domain
MLKDRISQFTFSRLSKTGEGADLELPTSKAYSAFLNSYVDEAQNNPLLSHKDGLTNIILEERALPLCRGCTGFGCGAAFNFIALLADGEVHACRKFPSPLGNILDRDFNEVYDSHSAQSFRGGSHACRDCNLLAVCGGCLAVTAGEGQDFLTVRDPHCFRQTV